MSSPIDFQRVLRFAVRTPEQETLPAKTIAKNTFWGLGDRYWQQIIPERDHPLDPMVYDQHSYKGVRQEPSFSDSLYKGCTFAAEHLTEPLTVDFYRKLHRVLCAHFQGLATQIEFTL
ncbi:MAG: hypothetical protein KGZ39_06575 [Simkania sp.]|nr:hypothetical protein [Simkania sp.]